MNRRQLPVLQSASRQPLLMKCIGSSVLPRVASESRAADVGTLKHEHLELRNKRGLDEALAAMTTIGARLGLPDRDVAIATALMRRFTWMPPKGAVSEIALCLMSDGRVVRVDGGQGDYDVPDGAMLPGTIDLIWSEPEPLIVHEDGRIECPKGSLLFCADWKTGDEANVTPIERNEQVLANALMAGRFTGAERVVPTLIYPAPGDGDWEQTDPIRVTTLARVEERLREREELAIELRAAHARGEPIPLTSGPWCTYCPSSAYCPEKVAQLQAIVALQPPAAGRSFTPEEATWWADRLAMIGQLRQKASEALKAYVAATGKPIPMSNGNVWGPVFDTEEEIVPDVAMAVLREELGDGADKVLSTSKAAIERAVKADHEEKKIKRKVGPTVSRILAKLHAAGAIKQNTSVSYRAQRPALPAADEDLTPKLEASLQRAS